VILKLALLSLIRKRIHFDLALVEFNLIRAFPFLDVQLDGPCLSGKHLEERLLISTRPQSCPEERSQAISSVSDARLNQRFQGFPAVSGVDLIAAVPPADLAPRFGAVLSHAIGFVPPS